MISNNFSNVTISSLTFILRLRTGQPLENTVSAEDILVVLLSDQYICVFELYLSSHDNVDEIKKLWRRLDCPEQGRGLLTWRARCIGKMIVESDITHIRDEKIKLVDI